MRIDKWLWAARFFKTRGLAQRAVEAGAVLVAGERVKPARELRVGDEVAVKAPDGNAAMRREVRVVAFSDRRGPAAEAQALYEETQASVARRVAELARRREAPEPAEAIRGGRPTKRERRELDRWSGDPG